MNIVKIDTSDNLSTKVEIEFNGRKFTSEEKREKPGDQNVLELLEKLLNNNNLKLEEVLLGRVHLPVYVVVALLQMR